jgi:hypothetical protein
MTSDELQDQLSETWYRSQSADDAHDAIWGEPFDRETVRISDIAKIIREALDDLRDGKAGHAEKTLLRFFQDNIGA